MKNCLFTTVFLLFAISGNFAQFTNVTGGLINPTGVEIDDNGNAIVTETGNGTNNARVLLVRPNGDKIPIIIGLPSFLLDSITGESSGAWRTMRLPNNRMAVIIGGGPTPLFGRIMLFNLTGFQAGVSPAKRVADTTSTIDISTFAMAQSGVAETDPFSAALDKDGNWYVADAAANMIIKVTPTGQKSIFARFPGFRNPTPIGPPFVDAVPTKIIAKPEGGFYVCTLTGFPFLEGRAAIYSVSATGVVTPYVTNMSLLTDMQLDPRTGDLYALQFGSFGFAPSPGFIFGSGKVFRIGRDGGVPVLVDGNFGPGPGLSLDKNGSIYVTSIFTAQLLKKTNATRCFKLDLNLTADNPIALYNSIKYSLTVTNNDVVPATNVRVFWLPPYKRFEGDVKPFALQGYYSSKGRYDGWGGFWVIPRLEPGESATAYFHLFVVNTQLDATQNPQIANCNELNPNFLTFSEPNLALKENVSKIGTAFSINPNPANDKINIVIDNMTDKGWTLNLLNTIGQTIFSQKGYSNQTVNIDSKSLQNGLYIVDYQSEGERKTGNVLIQH
jgi:hypothetical protein